MRVMTILGTRPELIKLSEVIKKLDAHTDHRLIHTGQNYDFELDGIFYSDLGLRRPDKNLLATTVPQIIARVDRELEAHKPDAVVILGDTNSSMAGYAVKRRKIPLFHLEAGNRCFDDNVPEEINRRIIDHIADMNLVYTEHARRNLLAEGLKADRIYLTGSPMAEIIENQEVVDQPLDPYYLVSIHREENVDNPRNLGLIVSAINELSMSHNVILSCHPRLAAKKAEFANNVDVHKPFGFSDYLNLQRNAKCVISDSGTVAEESAILGFPAVTVREAMERPEAIDAGSIIKANPDNIIECVSRAKKPIWKPSEYGTDNFSDRVLNIILGYRQYVNKFVWHK